MDWNTFQLIVEQLQGDFCLEELLKVPISSYYDFIRLIVMHLSKSDNKICLSPRPNPIMELNPLVKIYKQDGQFVKLALMNHYDTEVIVGYVDCYIA